MRGTEYISWKTTAIIWKAYIVAEAAGSFLGIVSIGLCEGRDRKVYTSALKLPVYSSAIRYNLLSLPSPQLWSPVLAGALLGKNGLCRTPGRGQGTPHCSARSPCEDPFSHEDQLDTSPCHFPTLHSSAIWLQQLQGLTGCHIQGQAVLFCIIIHPDGFPF